MLVVQATEGVVAVPEKAHHSGEIGVRLLPPHVGCGSNRSRGVDRNGSAAR